MECALPSRWNIHQVRSRNVSVCRFGSPVCCREYMYTVSKLSSTFHQYLQIVFTADENTPPLPPACPLTRTSFQDPSVQQRAALRAKRKELGRPETELACWLLEALAKTSDGDYGKSVMYREATLVTLVRCGLMRYLCAALNRIFCVFLSLMPLPYFGRQLARFTYDCLCGFWLRYVTCVNTCDVPRESFWQRIAGQHLTSIGRCGVLQ